MSVERREVHAPLAMCKVGRRRIALVYQKSLATYSFPPQLEIVEDRSAQDAWKRTTSRAIRDKSLNAEYANLPPDPPAHRVALHAPLDSLVPQKSHQTTFSAS